MMATLSYLVRHILGVRGQKEMSRITAWRIIATVTDAHSRRNRTHRKFPRHPIRLKRRRYAPTSCGASYSAISMSVSTPHPWPTFIWPGGFIDKFFKSICQRHDTFCHFALFVSLCLWRERMEFAFTTAIFRFVACWPIARPTSCAIASVFMRFRCVTSALRRGLSPSSFST